MFRKFVSDESGIALGLAVIMIVLIGVMGAGLLVFVRNDLNAVVEVNQGQKALNLADAGVQAAERQLLSDATANSTENHYDADDTNGDTAWSPFNNGKDLTIDGETVNVEIQYLLPSDTSSELEDPNHAPELTPDADGDGSLDADYPEPEDYFKITADATIGDARRKVEAIYYTMDMGVPKGYYTPGDIEVNGSACVDSVSLFAQGNIDFNGGGDGCGDVDLDGEKENLKGPDVAYGDWDNPDFNTTARSGPTCTAADGTTGMCAGAGAVGQISGSRAEVGTRDYDGVDLDADGPEFIRKDPPDKVPQDPNDITFPFDYALPDIDFLRDIAKQQGYYNDVSGGTENISNYLPPGGWPSDHRTVMYFKFPSGGGSNTMQWDIADPNKCEGTPREGMIVVENGGFKLQANKAPFEGVVVVRKGTAEGDATATGKSCLKGFINAEDTIKIAGNVSPSSLPPDVKRPGFYGVDLWSWRECYNEACN